MNAIRTNRRRHRGIGGADNRKRHSLSRKALQFELLEARRVLDAASLMVDALPNWFESVNSRYDAGFDKREIYGPVQWLEPSVATLQLADAAIAEIGAIADVETWFPSELNVHLMHGLGKPGQLAVGIASDDAEFVLDQVRQHPGVASASFSANVNGFVIPDDPEFGQLHGLSNTGQNGGISDADIDAPAAWDITTGSLENVVAVIDSGVDYVHPDLFLNIWINQGEVPASLQSLLVDSDSDGLITFRDLNQPANSTFVSDINNSGFIDAGDLLDDPTWENGIDDDGNGFVDDLVGWDFRNNDNDPFDDHRHGTHVTGTIAATGNNGTGVAGLNWQAQVMPLKFLDSNNRGSTADAIPAIHYATMMRTNYGVNVRATNNSWGTLDGDVPALESAIADSALADILFVAGAGNGNVLGQGINLDASPQKFYPASYTEANIISVAAGDTDDTIAVFSNFGAASVDLSAPGVGILSAEPFGGYASRNGTSMAAPHVTGAALLVWANLPDATMNEVRRAILESVDNKPGLASSLSTGGRLNARGAIDIDTFAPRASLLTADDITIGTSDDQLVEVAYTDNVTLALCAEANTETCSALAGAATLSDSDLIIIRQDNPDDLLPVRLDLQSSVFPVASATASYFVSAPDGTWNIADNGTYEIRLRAGEVADTNGNSNFEIVLGTFEVNISYVGQINVTTTLDGADSNVGDGISDDGSGNSTLRSAIQEANFAPGENTIVLLPETYTFSVAGVGEDASVSGDLDVTDTLTIIGNGATIDAASLDRVFDVAAGATLNLQDVTITGGNATGDGGGIRDVGGTINIIRSTLLSNIASGDGGAIYTSGAFNAENITVSGNTAETGGGVFADGATLELRNSTITGNTALGIAVGAGGVYAYPSANIHNTIIAGNSATVEPDVFGDFTGSTFNLIGNVDGASGLTDGVDGNQVGTSATPLDPLLGALRFNGGLTATHALLSGIPAIDAANNAFAPTDDQRQFARPLDANRDGIAIADIGAVEKYFGEISGTVYNDQNADGAKQIANDFPFTGASELTAVGDAVYFALNSRPNGSRLWKSDRFGTRSVTSFSRFGGPQPTVSNLVALNDQLVFTVNDSFRGRELWITDGTSGGTRLVKDINPGLPDSNPSNLTRLGDVVYFSADDGVNGVELWRTDGTEFGTFLVANINDGSLSSDPQELTTLGDTLFFTADISGRIDLFKTLGNRQNTRSIFSSQNSDLQNVSELTAVGDSLLFAKTDRVGDRELWKTSGDFSTQELVANVFASGSSNPHELTNVGGTLLFAAEDDEGTELWKSESPFTAVAKVADIHTGAGSSMPSNLTAVGSTVFLAADDSITGVELWKSESPFNSVEQVADISVGSSNPSELTPLNGRLAFAANDGTVGNELWVTDGTGAGTFIVSDIHPSEGSDPSQLTNVDGTIFFSASDNEFSNRLMQVDGSSLQVNAVVDLSESGLSGQTVYLDINSNGTFDLGEPSTVTLLDDPLTVDEDESGQYLFTGLDSRKYTVRTVVADVFAQTSPLPLEDPGRFELGSLELINGGDLKAGTVLSTPGNVAFGERSANVGDVNGDSIDDFVLSVVDGAYLIYGLNSGLPRGSRTVEEIGVDSRSGVRLTITGLGSSEGVYSVSGVGDVNRDGVNDIFVGATNGVSYVVYGSSTLPAEFDLQQLTAANGGDGTAGFTITGSLPYSASGVGDVNRDGVGDFVIGDIDRRVNGEGVGAAYLIYGFREGRLGAELDVQSFATSDGSVGTEIRGFAGNSGLGTSVGGGNDINGDGIADIVIGAASASSSSLLNNGRVVVVYGNSTRLPGLFDVSQLLPSNGGDGSRGFVVNGEFESARLGWSIDTGFFDSDPYADIVIGTEGAQGAYILRGASSIAAEQSIAEIYSPIGISGTYINSTEFSTNRLAQSVGSVGDANGDGIDDILIGWEEAAPKGPFSGSAYLVYGQANGLGANFDLASLEEGSGVFGISYLGEQFRSGFHVSAAGDLNNDGASDFFIAAKEKSTGESFGYLVAGKARNIAYTSDNHWIVDLLPGNAASNVDFGNAALTGKISGTSFRDLNGNAVRDAGETGIAGFTVFIDENTNGVFDEGEPSQVTDVDGRYSFAGLDAFRDYTIVQLPLAGLEQTFPTPVNNRVWSISLGAGQEITVANFGNKDLIAGVGSGVISGRLWDDVNGNGVVDAGENGIAGQQIYIDVNNNETKDVFEPTRTTDSTGNYTFNNVGEGVFTVRVVKAAGQELTTPLGSSFTTQSLNPDQGPQSLASGDINGDNFPDLIVANYVTNNLSIFLNNGNGTFANGVNYPTGFGPISVAVADVDGVNGNDIVIGHQLSSFVGVLKNNGSGGFGLLNQIPVGAGPVSVAVADINGTGGPDIVVANQYTDQATVLYNNGSGGFNTVATLPVGDQPFDVTVGQFDNQFGPDLAVVNSASGTVSIWLHTGGAGFAQSFTKTVGMTPLSIDSADLDGDSILDLVVANVLSDSVSVLDGLGNGTFQNAKHLPAGLGPSSITISDIDIDGDNRPDLLVTNGGADNLAVLKNLGGGEFQSPENFGVAQVSISLAWAATAADFDSDGVIDVAVANGDDDSVSIMSNTLIDGAFRIAMTGDETFSNINFGVRIPDLTIYVTNTKNGGAGSLRQAIIDANNRPGLDTINFNIPGSGAHTISPQSPLPLITDPVIIDGTSEPGFVFNPLIILNGTNAGATADGLKITAGGSTVKGLAINRFGGDGIELRSGDGNVIEGNRIGTSPYGNVNLGNSRDGLFIVNSSGNTIGGTTAAQRNVISGNGRHGIEILNNGSTGNVVQGNRIGTNAAGTVALPNSLNGVNVSNAPSNTIGGAQSGARNVISGNTKLGVVLTGAGSTGNVVQGNYIGTNAGGTIDVGNGLSGVQISGNASGNTIGGTTAISRNVISGNDRHGVLLTGAGVTNNVIQGNYIGTRANGSAALGHSMVGVFVMNASSNTIGGTVGGSANKIGFNGQDGVRVTGSGTDNRIRRNSIFQNTNHGIDLNNDGVTANDINDADNGPNRLQNFPVITSAILNGANIDFTYSIPSSIANSTFPIRVEFFIADSNNQEGKTFLSSRLYTSPGSKTVSIPKGAVVVGSRIVATATDDNGNGNTSEFSASAAVTSPSFDGLATNASNPSDVNGDGDVTALDALMVINALNVGLGEAEPGNVSSMLATPNKVYLDVDGNSKLTAVDALWVINSLNLASQSRGQVVADEPDAIGEVESDWQDAVDSFFEKDDDLLNETVTLTF